MQRQINILVWYSCNFGLGSIACTESMVEDCVQNTAFNTHNNLCIFVCTIFGAYNIITAYISRITFHSEI